MEPPAKSRISSKESRETAQDWQKIDKLPPGPRELVLFSLPLSELAFIYQLPLESIHKTLSKVKFWQQKLENEGLLSSRFNNQIWLNFWVGMSEAGKMIEYLSGKDIDDPFTQKLDWLIKYKIHFEKAAIPETETRDEFDFLIESFEIIQDNFNSAANELNQAERTMSIISWILKLTQIRKSPSRLKRGWGSHLYLVLTMPNILKDIRPNQTLSYATFLKSWKDLPYDNQIFASFLEYLQFSSFPIAYYPRKEREKLHSKVNNPRNIEKMKENKDILLALLEALPKNLQDYDYGQMSDDNQNEFNFVIRIEQGQPIFHLALSIKGGAEETLYPKEALALLKEFNIHSSDPQIMEPSHPIEGLWLDNGPFVLEESSVGQPVEIDGYKLYGSYL